MLGFHSDMQTKLTAASVATVFILNRKTLSEGKCWIFMEMCLVIQSTMVKLHFCNLY